MLSLEVSLITNAEFEIPYELKGFRFPPFFPDLPFFSSKLPDIPPSDLKILAVYPPTPNFFSSRVDFAAG